jgi:hypothetical protein
MALVRAAGREHDRQELFFENAVQRRRAFNRAHGKRIRNSKTVRLPRSRNGTNARLKECGPARSLSARLLGFVAPIARADPNEEAFCFPQLVRYL